MTAPDNKYCTQCSCYNDLDLDFFDKYGELGCDGIIFRSGEFPYESKAFCFTDGPLLTVEELEEEAIKAIQKIIEDNSAEDAAKLIYNNGRITGRNTI